MRRQRKWLRWQLERAQGTCPGNELGGVGFVEDALSVITKEVAGEVSISCKRFLKTK